MPFRIISRIVYQSKVSFNLKCNGISVSHFFLSLSLFLFPSFSNNGNSIIYELFTPIWIIWQNVFRPNQTKNRRNQQKKFDDKIQTNVNETNFKCDENGFTTNRFYTQTHTRTQKTHTHTHTVYTYKRTITNHPRLTIQRLRQTVTGQQFPLCLLSDHCYR